MAATRVLVVDDSALMRRYLRDMLEDAGFAVAQARNGREALAMVAEWDPNVVTLDVNMPEMDGLTCLRRLMDEDPRPVVMVSSLTEEGAAVTLDALELGAVDFIAKPDGTISRRIGTVRDELIGKIAAAARARVRRASGLRQRIRRRRIETQTRRAAVDRPVMRSVPGLVLVGVSTGGPGALEDILPRLPGAFPWPVVVAQHMPGSFTGVFARRMANACELDAVEVDRPLPLEPGRIYIGAGDADLVVEKRLGRLVANSVPEDPSCPWHPSVDRLVDSALEHLPARQLVGVLLTGMGYDGAGSMARLHKKGGRTVAEAEETAVVFGMPAELIRLGGAGTVLPCGSIATQLTDWVGAVGKEERLAAGHR